MGKPGVSNDNVLRWSSLHTAEKKIMRRTTALRILGLAAIFNVCHVSDSSAGFGNICHRRQPTRQLRPSLSDHLTRQATARVSKHLVNTADSQLCEHSACAGACRRQLAVLSCHPESFPLSAIAMPPSSLPLNRRFITLLVATLSVLSLISLIISFSNRSSVSSTSSNGNVDSSSPSHIKVSPSTLHGGVISSKIGNETVKAELGRAAWKVLHTTMAKFPDAPTEDEQTALLSYIHLFARLYPWFVPRPSYYHLLSW